ARHRGEPRSGCRRATRGARAAHAAHDRERFRADRPVGARRPRHDPGAPRSGPPRPARARDALRPARGGDRAVRVVETPSGLQLEGEIGFVPTMGAFHDGHLSLFRAAREENEVVVVSLFVNPAQYDEDEDLGRYPRNATRDFEPADEAGVDVLFVPNRDEMYPPGFQTWVEVEQLGSMLEGQHRPGHFRGVATVCLKLFNLVRPQRAYFGQKDAQQVAVVKQMVRDL